MSLSEPKLKDQYVTDIMLIEWPVSLLYNYERESPKSDVK
jgi:hypothetical protein